MSIDRFGSQRTASVKRYIHQFSINRDGKGNYQFRNKRLCTVKDPEEDNDATTKHYVDTLTTSTENRMQEFTEKVSYERMGELQTILGDHIKKSLDDQHDALMSYLERNELKRDSGNNIILDAVRMKILLPAQEDHDVPNKKTVLEYITTRTLPMDSNGNITLKKRRIREIADPIDDSDAASKKFVKQFVSKKQNEAQQNLTQRLDAIRNDISEIMTKHLETVATRQSSLDKHITTATNNIHE